MNCCHLLEPWAHFCSNRLIAVKLCQLWPNHKGIIKYYKKSQWIPAFFFTVLPASQVLNTKSQAQVRSSSSKLLWQFSWSRCRAAKLREEKEDCCKLAPKKMYLLFMLFYFQLSLEGSPPALLKFCVWGMWHIFLTELENRNMFVPAPKSRAKQTVTLGWLKYKSRCLENPDLNTALKTYQCRIRSTRVLWGEGEKISLWFP